jgi:hypothetical protein
MAYKNWTEEEKVIFWLFISTVLLLGTGSLLAWVFR